MNMKLKFFSCIVFLTTFSMNIDAAEGGPCKDYGDCDEFNYSLNDIESLQRGASTYLNYCYGCCLLYTSPSPRDQRGSRMPSSA